MYKLLFNKFGDEMKILNNRCFRTNSILPLFEDKNLIGRVERLYRQLSDNDKERFKTELKKLQGSLDQWSKLTQRFQNKELIDFANEQAKVRSKKKKKTYSSTKQLFQKVETGRREVLKSKISFIDRFMNFIRPRTSS